MTDEERKALVERLRSAADRKGKPSGVHMIDGQRAIAKVMLSKLDDEDAQAIGQVADCMALCIENEAMLFECLVSEVLPAADQIEADGQRIAELEEALGWFLNDSRFVVQVGGNPNVVPQMIEAARAALGKKA